MTTLPNIQVYFDEDVPHRLRNLLSDRGITVHLSQDIGTTSADDPVHLQTCTSHGWILITHNRKDFLSLHGLWMSLYYWDILPQPHSGILTVLDQDPLKPEEWAPAIFDLLREQESFKGLMYMWRPSSRRWEPQPVRFR